MTVNSFSRPTFGGWTSICTEDVYYGHVPNGICTSCGRENSNCVFDFEQDACEYTLRKRREAQEARRKKKLAAYHALFEQRIKLEGPSFIKEIKCLMTV